MRRLAIAMAATAIAVASLADYLAWRASHRRLSSYARELDPASRLPGISRDLRRETVPSRAATMLAWRLLQLEVDRAWMDELPAAERAAEEQRSVERLRLAARLAAETLPSRPASWQAATVLGVSRHLDATRGRRTEAVRASWREPLELARSLAPGHPEPPLLLAAVSLSRWSSLSHRERDEAMPALSAAFAAPGGLDLLLGRWLRLAPSLARLLEPIPDRAPAWQKLGRQFLAAGDLERFATTRTRWLAAMPGFLAGRVAQASARRRGGDSRSAARLLQSVVAAPHDLALVESFSAALSGLEAPVSNRRALANLERWLAWALDLCAIGRCPFDAETLGLVARAVEPAPAELALAALAAGDLRSAIRRERVSGPAEDGAWNRYWILKAHQLAGADPERAGAALARATPSAADEIRYWRAAERLARAAGDDASLGRARTELERLALREPAGGRWIERGRVLRLELPVAAPAVGLRLRFADVRPEGAAIDCRWDGRSVGVAAVLQPDSVHRWRLPVEPGLHLLEIENLTGRTLRPVAVTLEPAPRAE